MAPPGVPPALVVDAVTTNPTGPPAPALGTSLSAVLLWTPAALVAVPTALPATPQVLLASAAYPVISLLTLATEKSTAPPATTVFLVAPLAPVPSAKSIVQATPHGASPAGEAMATQVAFLRQLGLSGHRMLI